MSPEYERQYQQRVAKAVRLTLNEIGRRMRDYIRNSISTPVTYIGSYAIRSSPGEPPYRETGELWRSITYRVQPAAKTVDDLRVWTDDPKAVWLELGTQYMEPRPFFTPAWRHFGGRAGIRRLFEQLFPDILREELRKNPIVIT